MRYEFNLDNVKKLIYSDLVPENDEDGLEFYLDDLYVRIRKFYFEDEEDLAEFIYFEDENEEIAITIAITEDKELGMEVSYKTINNNDFFVLEETSPEFIKDFFNTSWSKIFSAYHEGKISQEISDRLLFEDFTLMFKDYGLVPNDLKLLFEFEHTFGAESYSESFYLTASDKTGVESWSSEEEFSKAFIEFSSANGSGSFYAFWMIENSIENCPIIVFGDEGGIHVVANSIREFIHLLSYDTEITVSFEEVYFYKDEEEYEHSEYHKEYVDWMKKNFGLNAITTEDEIMHIVENAQTKYQDQLNDFLTEFSIEI